MQLSLLLTFLAALAAPALAQTSVAVVTVTAATSSMSSTSASSGAAASTTLASGVSAPSPAPTNYQFEGPSTSNVVKTLIGSAYEYNSLAGLRSVANAAPTGAIAGAGRWVGAAVAVAGAVAFV